MDATQDRLPDDPDQLKQLVVALLSEKAAWAAEKKSLQSELQQVRLKLLRFKEQQRLLLAKRFGASSEKSPQIALFNEAEALLQEEAAIADDVITQAEDEEPISVPAHQRRKRGRVTIPEDLARQDIIHEPPEEGRVCSCGCTLTEIGQETSEQIDVRTPEIRVLRHICKKYACKHCEEGTLKTAPKPPQPIERSNTAPGLLALYRQQPGQSPCFSGNLQFDRNRQTPRTRTVPLSQAGVYRTAQDAECGGDRAASAVGSCLHIRRVMATGW